VQELVYIQLDLEPKKKIWLSSSNTNTLSFSQKTKQKQTMKTSTQNLDLTENFLDCLDSENYEAARDILNLITGPEINNEFMVNGEKINYLSAIVNSMTPEEEFYNDVILALISNPHFRPAGPDSYTMHTDIYNRRVLFRMVRNPGFEPYPDVKWVSTKETFMAWAIHDDFDLFCEAIAWHGEKMVKNKTKLFSDMIELALEGPMISEFHRQMKVDLLLSLISAPEMTSRKMRLLSNSSFNNTKASELCAKVVSISDKFLKIRHKSDAALATWTYDTLDKSNKAMRFFEMTSGLCLELQMKICNLTEEIHRDTIPSHEMTSAFKSVLNKSY
jgi:hypothetical protein